MHTKLDIYLYFTSGIGYQATIPEGNYGVIFELSFPALYYYGMLKLDDVAVQSEKCAEGILYKPNLNLIFR
jgi:hypothetical protein